MKQTFVIQSVSGERAVTVESNPCNGDSSFVSYQLFNDGVRFGGGVAKPSEIRKLVTKWAKRMLIGVTSVKPA